VALQPTTAEALVEEAFLFGRALRFAVSTGDASSPLPAALTGVLAVLATEGECRQTDLAKQLCVSQSALSRQIADLVEVGYITRHADPDDGRASRVSVSDEGFQRLALIKEQRVTRLGRMLGEWSEDEALAAIDSIRHLKDTFTKDGHHQQAVSHLKLIAR